MRYLVLIPFFFFTQFVHVKPLGAADFFARIQIVDLKPIATVRDHYPDAAVISQYAIVGDRTVQVTHEGIFVAQRFGSPRKLFKLDPKNQDVFIFSDLAIFRGVEQISSPRVLVIKKGNVKIVTATEIFGGKIAATEKNVESRLVALRDGASRTYLPSVKNSVPLELNDFIDLIIQRPDGAGPIGYAGQRPRPLRPAKALK